MKRLSCFGSAIVVALVLGIGSAWLATARGFTLRNGPWEHDPLVGNAAAGPYLRACVGRTLPLALNRSEAVYLVARTDSDGRDLRSDARYRIEGRDLGARWWSITCYDANGYLIANPRGRYSYNMTGLARDADGTYSIALSQDERPGNWLPTGDGRKFQVVLRLYNPAPSLLERLDTVELPRILREDDAHD